mgnify:CR=1 FL=1
MIEYNATICLKIVFNLYLSPWPTFMLHPTKLCIFFMWAPLLQQIDDHAIDHLCQFNKSPSLVSSYCNSVLNSQQHFVVFSIFEYELVFRLTKVWSFNPFALEPSRRRHIVCAMQSNNRKCSMMLITCCLWTTCSNQSTFILHTLHGWLRQQLRCRATSSYPNWLKV